jgi:hypothetical protein
MGCFLLGQYRRNYCVDKRKAVVGTNSQEAALVKVMSADAFENMEMAAWPSTPSTSRQHFIHQPHASPNAFGVGGEVVWNKEWGVQRPIECPLFRWQKRSRNS